MISYCFHLRMDDDLRSTRMDDDLGFLSALPYFRGLPTAELSHLRGRCYTRILERGELIVLEGEPAAGLYVVRRGKVRVFKTSPQGKEQLLIVLGPGETFNDVPVFDGGTNPASAQAAVPEPACAWCRRPW